MQYEELADSNEDRADWLEKRRTLIGASDMPAIMGEVNWATPMDVWAEKIGAGDDDFDRNERMDWGQRLEPLIIAAFSQRTGRQTTSDGRLYRSTRWPFLGATPDASQWVDAVHLPLEIKNVDRFVYRQRWDAGVPRYVWIQVQQTMAVLEAPSASVAILIGGNEFGFYDVERDDDFIDGQLIPTAEKFWQSVVDAEVPPLDNRASTRKALAKHFGEGNGEVVQLDDDAVANTYELIELQAKKRNVEQQIEGLKNELALAIGEASYGQVAEDLFWKWTQQTRQAHEVRESSFRSLRSVTKGP